jgi:hypothetical protein
MIFTLPAWLHFVNTNGRGTNPPAFMNWYNNQIIQNLIHNNFSIQINNIGHLPNNRISRCIRGALRRIVRTGLHNGTCSSRFPGVTYVVI